MRGIEKFGISAAAIAIATAGTLASFEAHAIKVGDITVAVEPATNSFYTSPNRSLLGAYKFTLTNGGSSSLNNVRFEVTARAVCAEQATNSASTCGLDSPPVFDGDNPVEKADASCTPDTANPSRLLCQVGTSGPIPKDKTVFFHFGVVTPRSSGEGTLPDGTRIAIDWNVRYGLGTTNPNSTIQVNDDPAGSVGLVKSTTENFESFVPPAGLFLFTGNQNQPAGSDTLTVSADIIPTTNSVVVAGITEKGNGCPTDKRCIDMKINAKNADGGFDKATFGGPAGTLAQKLVFTFRMDYLALPTGYTSPSAYVAAGKIVYWPSGEVGTGSFKTVRACPTTNKNYVPDADNNPCVSRASVLGKNMGPDLWKDWEFLIFSTENGRFVMD